MGAMRRATSSTSALPTTPPIPSASWVWLQAAAANGIDEELEPSVPPGLRELSAPLAEFVRFFQLDSFLRRLAAGEPLLALKFNRRLQELAGPPARPQAVATRRTWVELRETAERLRQAEERRQEAEARQIKDLQDFAPRAAQAWRDIQALIEKKKARPYDDAVALLVKLRDLAAFQGRLPEFQAKLAALQAQYANQPAFQERLRKARLV